MNKSIHLVMVVALLAMVGVTRAQTPPPRPYNWGQQLGAAAVDPELIRTVMVQVPPAERVDFTRRLLKAISSMPISPEEKSKLMARAAVVLVASSGESKRDVIGAIFAYCPIVHLGAVSQALAVGFDQKKNGLSNEAYLTIATNLMAGVVAEVAKGGNARVGTGLSDTAQSDDIVRLTVAAATLVRSASDPAAVEAALMALIPSESRALIARVLPMAVKGDYGPLMDLVGNEERMVLPVVFAPSMVRYALLAQIDIRRSADESRFVSVGIERQWGNTRPLPVIPLPIGYQNQGIIDRITDGGFYKEVKERVEDSELLYRLRIRPGRGCGVPIFGCGVPIFGCGGSIIDPCNDCGVLP
jgi:hypothetical protein